MVTISALATFQAITHTAIASNVAWTVVGGLTGWAIAFVLAA